MLLTRKLEIDDKTIAYIEASVSAQRQRLETEEAAKRERLEVEAAAARRLASRTRIAAVITLILAIGIAVSMAAGSSARSLRRTASF